MKTIMLFLGGMIAALLIVVVHNYNMLTPIQKQIAQMQRTCEASSQVLNGNLEVSCSEQIDALQARGFEVLSKDGKFTAEWNPEATK